MHLLHRKHKLKKRPQNSNADLNSLLTSVPCSKPQSPSAAVQSQNNPKCAVGNGSGVKNEYQLVLGEKPLASKKRVGIDPKVSKLNTEFAYQTFLLGLPDKLSYS